MRKFVPELTWGSVVNKIVKPITRYHVFSQERVSTQLVCTHEDTREVWRVDIHRLDAVSAMPVDPLFDALPKVPRVEAFARSPIFRRRHPLAVPVHQLLDIVVYVAIAVRFEVDTTTISSALGWCLSRYVACFYPDVFALSLRLWFWLERVVPFPAVVLHPPLARALRRNDWG